jgi:cytochrome c
MSGSLNGNKILGAALATAFVIVGVQQVTGAIYHTEAPEKMGYFVDAPEEAAGGAAEVVLPPDWGTVLPAADLAAGEAAFARCQACHDAHQGGADKIGPNLWAVVGGPVMHRAGFAYSDAMSAHKAEAPNWGYDELDQFITAPARYVPGTKMSFAGIRDQQTRINLIAWLRTQGSGGYSGGRRGPGRGRSGSGRRRRRHRGRGSRRRSGRPGDHPSDPGRSGPLRSATDTERPRWRQRGLFRLELDQSLLNTAALKPSAA